MYQDEQQAPANQAGWEWQEQVQAQAFDEISQYYQELETKYQELQKDTQYLNDCYYLKLNGE